MGININAINAELTNLNVRKEGDEGNRVLAIDMKFICETTSTVARTLLGADHVPHFWLPAGDCDPLYYAISDIHTEGVFQDHQLSFATVKFDSVRIDKCQFKPISHERISLAFRASVISPQDSKVAILAELVKESGDLVVVSPPDMFDEREAA